MEYIYYCVECKKFFYQDATDTVQIVKCIHCSSASAILCEKDKESYGALTDEEKEKFKNEIRSTYKNLQDIRKEATKREIELKKKIMKNTIITTGDLKQNYEIIGPVYYQISNRGIFANEISEKINEYKEAIEEMKKEGIMSVSMNDYGFLYGNYSVGQKLFEPAFYIATQELKKRAVILGGDAVIFMRQDIDIETENINNFYLQMYGTAVKICK